MNELLAQIKSKGNTTTSEVPATETTRKMSQEQIQSRRRTTVNNIAERQMFGFASNNYKNKFKTK